MFFRIYLYQLKQGFRDKNYILWCMLFPFMLGTLFFVAFNSIYENESKTQIPIAIVEDGEEGKVVAGVMEDVLKDIEYDDGSKVFDITVAKADKAQKLLKDEKADGIIEVESFEDIKLKIRKNGVNESIITSVLTAFKNKLDIHNYVETKGLLAGNKDPYIQYIYNLIAMVCMLSSTPALIAVTETRSNMNKVGVRIDISPVNKTVLTLAKVAATFTIQCGIMVASLIYYINILGMNFGADVKYIYLTGVLATLLGTSLGFLVGSIGNAKESVKNAILLLITLVGGFMSGLMVGNMKIFFEEKAPIINRINPSAVITDAFYSLNMYGVGDRYFRSVVYMVGLSLVFIVIGIVMSKRSSYASI